MSILGTYHLSCTIIIDNRESLTVLYTCPAEAGAGTLDVLRSTSQVGEERDKPNALSPSEPGRMYERWR